MARLTVMGSIFFDAHIHMAATQPLVTQMGIVVLIRCIQRAHEARLVEEAAEGQLPPLMVGTSRRARAAS